MIYIDVKCALSGKEPAVFGYVKPYVPSLSVAEYEAYRGAYCGLCRTMGSLTGQLSRLTLSYDLAFLVIYRLAAERLPAKFERKGCIAHPFSRRTHMKRNPVLEYCAAASAVLTAGKIRDDATDESGGKRFRAKLLLPFGNSITRRVRKKVGALEEAVKLDLEELSRIEGERTASLDAPAGAYAAALSKVVSFGLEGNAEKISKEIGRAMGKIIYVLDAADDLADDVRGEKYNPLALIYDEPFEDPSAKRPLLKKEIADELYTAVGIEANRAAASFELLDDTDVATYKGFVMNVLTLGIRAEAERVFFGRGKKDDPIKFNY